MRASDPKRLRMRAKTKTKKKKKEEKKRNVKGKETMKTVEM